MSDYFIKQKNDLNYKIYWAKYKNTLDWNIIQIWNFKGDESGNNVYVLGDTKLYKKEDFKIGPEILLPTGLD